MLAQACLCHRLLIQQLLPRGERFCTLSECARGAWNACGLLQPSAAPPIVLNGGGRECGDTRLDNSAK